MKHDLTERYIYAVTKRLPHKSGAEVAQELRTLIEDMLAERSGNAEPSPEVIKAVLTELGDPRDLYEKYDEDSKGCLIGSPYYTTYKLVLKVVLASVAVGLCVSGFVGLFTSGGATWLEVGLRWVGTMLSGLVYAFGFVTLLFSFFYRKNIDIREGVRLEDLPPVPRAGNRISRGECALDIACSILFIAIFIFVPQLLSAFITETWEAIPIFNLAVIRESLLPIILFGGAEIVRETVKLLEGQYTQKVMVTTIATNFASAIFAFWWLYSDKIMNPVFVSRIAEIISDDGGIVTGIFGNFNNFLLAVMLFALVLDTVVTVVKSIRG